MEDFERRLQRLEDQMALGELNVRYFLAADGDDLEALGACYADDGVFEISGNVVASGRQAIIDFNRKARGEMGLTLHTPHYGLYDFPEAGRAKGLLGAHLELAMGGKAVFGAVRYEDNYIRTAQGWLYLSRNMRTVYIGPWAKAGDALASDLPVQWPGSPPAASDYPRR
jgi:hypothetical protein